MSCNCKDQNQGSVFEIDDKCSICHCLLLLFCHSPSIFHHLTSKSTANLILIIFLKLLDFSSRTFNFLVVQKCLQCENGPSFPFLYCEFICNSLGHFPSHHILKVDRISVLNSNSFLLFRKKLIFLKSPSVYKIKIDVQRLKR